MSEITISIREYTRLASGRQGLTTFSLHAESPVDATGITTLGSNVINLEAASAAVTLGIMARRQASLIDIVGSTTVVTNGEAQREKKWLVTGTDGDKLYQFSIGTADLSLLATDGSNEMAAGTPRTNLITAIEDLWTNDASDPITVTSIRYSSVRS